MLGAHSKSLGILNKQLNNKINLFDNGGFYESLHAINMLD